MKLRLLQFLVLCLSLQHFASAQISIEDRLYGYVLGIEGKSHDDRALFIESQLREMGVGFFSAPFEQTRIHGNDTVRLLGENIIARIGKGNKRIVVGAHYDAVPGSPGANDDGSGVAVTLGLVRSLKDVAWNYSVDFCFFDREEDGLFGSAAYVRQFVDRRTHLAMINLDIEGTGEEVYVGPVGGGDDDLLMPLVRRAASQTKFSFKEDPIYPDSDHESFAGEKLENISISVVPRGDSELLSEMVRNKWKVAPGRLPKVMRVMHTSDDLSREMTPEALSTSYEFTKAVLLLLNDCGK
ncbi:MAG: M28 family metallopeptidase [Bacteroidota bacterium]